MLEFYDDEFLLQTYMELRCWNETGELPIGQHCVRQIYDNMKYDNLEVNLHIIDKLVKNEIARRWYIEHGGMT